MRSVLSFDFSNLLQLMSGLVINLLGICDIFVEF